MRRAIASLVLSLVLAACGRDGEPRTGPDAGLPRAAVRPLELNDVSFLFPLPAVAGGELMRLTPDAFADVLLEQVPLYFGGLGATDVSGLRVVAARVDPCFIDDGGLCQRQLRLVVQPLASAEPEYLLDDVTLHLFFRLDDPDFADLVADLRQLAALAGPRTEDQPLGVHPVLLAEGLDGPYGLRLKETLTRFADRDRLVRLAAMELVKPGSMWGLRAFDVEGDALSVRPIPHAPSTTQVLLGSGGNGEFRLQDTDIIPQDDDDPLGPLRIGWLLEGAAADEVRAALGETYRLEDPTRSDAGSADCASCHWAGRARRMAEEVRPEVELGSPEAYGNPAHDLGGATGDAREPGPAMLPVAFPSPRMFGYLNDEPIVLQRVIHESAEVATAIDAAF